MAITDQPELTVTAKVIFHKSRTDPDTYYVSAIGPTRRWHKDIRTQRWMIEGIAGVGVLWEYVSTKDVPADLYKAFVTTGKSRPTK